MAIILHPLHKGTTQIPFIVGMVQNSGIRVSEQRKVGHGRDKDHAQKNTQSARLVGNA